MSSLAPICLFAYNRLEETKQTVEALKNNFLASKSELFIFSDGAKDKKSEEKINQVRDYLKTISGFKNIEIFESSENIGLANSIISGVTQVIEKYKKVIVLEDDLVTSPNFLDFMNQAVNFYQDNPKIFSISGFTLDLPSLKEYPKDYYLGYRASSWGWATWHNRWEKVDWGVIDYQEFNSSLKEKRRFNRGGSDMSGMLKNQMKGKIDSWAIRWCYNQFKENKYTVITSKSKVISVGFGTDATHTKNTKRFNTILDSGNKTTFSFSKDIYFDLNLTKEFQNKFSVLSRLKEKILNMMNIF